MKRLKYSALLVFTAVLLSIVVFHSGMNLKERVKPPSEMWGRHLSIGITDFRKSPSVFTQGRKTIAIFADEKGFKWVEMDKSGLLTDEISFTIKDYVPERLVKYQSAGGTLFWTENYDLFYTELKAGELNKKQLLSGILDFQLVENNGSIAIAVSTNAGISLYGFEQSGAVKLLAEAQVKEASNIDAAMDGRGDIFIVGASRTSPTDYELRLFRYGQEAGSLAEMIETVRIENFSTTREGSNSMNNLELGLTDNDVYVFYEIGKYSSQGIVARTYIGHIPKASGKIESLKFERFNPEENSEGKETYIASLKCLDGESDRLSMVFTTPIRTSVSREGSEVVYAVMEDGKITYKSIATNTGQWNSFASIHKLEGQYVASFLQTIGGTRYIVNLTSTAEEYKANLNDTVMADIKASVMDTIGAYVFSFFAIFINLITVSFILLWPITVDFFEWKYFFNKPLLTFRLGVLAETLLMYFCVDRIYRNPESVAFMPEILKYGFSPVVILLATAAIAYLIVRMYRKSKRDLHSFTELALFTLIHNTFIYFLYTAYIARF